MHDSIIFSIFLIFSGAALLATLALYARQALLVAYIAIGLLFGPSGLSLVSDPSLIRDIADVGIIFLLFLLGLNLEPQELKRLLREATLITLISSAAFALLGFLVAFLFGFALLDSLLIGAAMMFSSTIIGLKLLPTTALHHQRMGEVIVSVLLLQDMLAITVLLLLQGFGNSHNPWIDMALLLVSLPALMLFAYYFSKYVITHLLMSFDQIKEYIFLLAIGWCLGLAELAEVIGLSHEIGAFIAGITLATNPIARYIAENLKPLRDFFLVMFFFALGAGFNLAMLPDVLLPALALALLSLLFKPWLFKRLLQQGGEQQKSAHEIGVRLGQISEFALLVAIVASETELLSPKGSYLIQAATIISFTISSYWIVRFYPTPMAVDAKLRRD
ncbi:MAG: cation:proton antiporter [Gammaproteobacteria bacterium]|nr:cation:proton antiporter [Gammaproteobacteria bacterium]